MTRVLLTCPPMRGLVDLFRPRFEQAGIDLDLPPMVQTMTEDELVELLPQYDGWIAGDDPATGRVLRAGAAGKLRAVVKWGVGTDAVDFSAAEQIGLPVAHTPQVFGREVADVAMGYVIGLARQLFFIDREIRLGEGWPKPSGTSLAGQKVALVGYGDIGRQINRRLSASEMNVVVYDPAYTPASALEPEAASWPDRIGEADFIIFACPLTESTFHLFDSAVLHLVKPGLRLVNVARGPIVQEAALLEGLRSGRIHSAALDVFEEEPLAASSELRAFPLCIFGSHNASNTREAVIRVSHEAIEKLFSMMEHQERADVPRL